MSDRRATYLTDHVEVLRNSIESVRSGHPFRIDAIKDAKNYDMHGGSIFNTPGRSRDKVYQFYEHKIVEWFSNPQVEAALQN